MEQARISLLSNDQPFDVTLLDNVRTSVAVGWDGEEGKLQCFWPAIFYSGGTAVTYFFPRSS